MKTVRFSLGLMFFSSLAQSTPWGLPGDAVIASENGRLAICIPQEISETVVVNSISVSEIKPLLGKGLTMWQLELKKSWEAMLLESGGCIFYGAIPSGYQPVVDAKPLSIGGVYYTRINISVTNPTRQSILFFDAVFCMAKKNNDGPVYLQYIYDQAGKEVRPSLCWVSGEGR
jgi:hypothetical protein